MPMYATGRGGVGRATPPVARDELGRRRNGERQRSSHQGRHPPWGAAAPGRGELGLLGEVAHAQASFFGGAAAPCHAHLIRARRILMEFATEQHSCEQYTHRCWVGVLCCGEVFGCRHCHNNAKVVCIHASYSCCWLAAASTTELARAPRVEGRAGMFCTEVI